MSHSGEWWDASWDANQINMSRLSHHIFLYVSSILQSVFSSHLRSSWPLLFFHCAKYSRPHLWQQLSLWGNSVWLETHSPHSPQFSIDREEKYQQLLQWGALSVSHSRIPFDYTCRFVRIWAIIKSFYSDKQTHKTHCHVVALFSSNRNELNRQTVRSTTGPLSEGTHTFHIRTHLLKVVKTSLIMCSSEQNVNTKQKEKKGNNEFSYKKNWKWMNESYTLVHNLFLTLNVLPCLNAGLPTALI